METFFPTLMVAYLAGFRQAFSKPGVQARVVSDFVEVVSSGQRGYNSPQ